MRGLYIEDDLSLSKTVIESLKEKKLDVLWTRGVEESIEAIKNEKFSFFIIDVGLVDGEGFEVAEFIKRRGIKAPVLFLTARAGAKDRLKGYEHGAVEFIPKPFLFEELWMRLNHALEEHTDEETIFIDDLEINMSSYFLKWPNTTKVHLTEKEMGVLVLLYKKGPKVLKRSEILDQVWGKGQFPSERTVDNIILKLRQHLKHLGESIKSVRGVGYCWDNQKED